MSTDSRVPGARSIMGQGSDWKYVPRGYKCGFDTIFYEEYLKKIFTSTGGRRLRGYWSKMLDQDKLHKVWGASDFIFWKILTTIKENQVFQESLLMTLELSDAFHRVWNDSHK